MKTINKPRVNKEGLMNLASRVHRSKKGKGSYQRNKRLTFEWFVINWFCCERGSRQTQTTKEKVWIPAPALKGRKNSEKGYGSR